jgi:hypothetical protein
LLLWNLEKVGTKTGFAKTNNNNSCFWNTFHINGISCHMVFYMMEDGYMKGMSKASYVLGVEIHRICFEIFFYGKLQICRVPLIKGNYYSLRNLNS